MLLLRKRDYMVEKMNYELAKARADMIDTQIINMLKSGKSFRVEAGAGSGKTYSLHKVVEWIDKNKAKEFSRNNRQVACITYTNAAVDVIKNRISSGSSIVPSTIHNFAWDNIKNFKSTLLIGIEELELFPSDSDISKIQSVVYDLGVRYIQNNELHLSHDDVIKLFSWFLDKPKFRMLLTDRYPIILIDEYQDSFKSITDKFLKYFIEKEHGPQFGLFGDAWQTIYSNNGACGLIVSDMLIEIKKESNFRSQKVIIDALNKIRPELPQISALNENDGSIVVITTNDYRGPRDTRPYYKGELPEDLLIDYITSVKEKLKSKGWDKDSKVLMIAHKMLAKQQHYQAFLDALGDRFKDQDDKHFIFFRDMLEPLYYALEKQDVKAMYEVLGTMRQPIETKRQKKQWRDLTSALCVARQGTIYDVLWTAVDSRLIPIPPDIENYMKEYYSTDDSAYAQTTLKQFYEIKYEEVINAINFFKPDAVYSTDHGVKGEEYDNVLFVMGRGWNLYKFEDSLYKDEKSLQGKELATYIRNRNLFYVCCSRPRKRLAILVTVEINAQFETYLRNVFGADNVVPYSEFMM